MPGLGIGAGTAFRQDILANRPVAEPSIEGFFFFATDTDGGTLFQCTGTSWVAITNGIKSINAGPGINVITTPTTITINNTYSLPIASASVLGGIKVGSGLFIDAGGVLSNAFVLPSDIAYTDVANIFIKPQAISYPDDFAATGLNISVTGDFVTGLEVYSEDVSAATFTSRAGVGVGTGVPCVDIFADFTCLRLVQSLDGLDYVGVSVPNPVLEVFRGSSTFSGKIFTGPLIQGNDHPTGTQVSTGALIQLQKFSVDKFVIDNSGNIQTVSGVNPGNGRLLIGNGSGMSVATLTAGSNISITNGPGSITITATGGGGGGSTIPPYVKAWRLASQTLTGTTSARVGLDSTFIDVGTGTPQHDNVTNNTRLTCRLAGTYLVGAAVIGFANSGYNPAAEYELTILKNGSGFTGTSFEIHPGSVYSAGSSAIISWIIDLAVNDYIEMDVEVSGANPGDTFLLYPVGVPDSSPTLWMQFLGSGIGSGSIQHNGSLVGTRPTTNFIDGSNVTLTVADNSGSNRVDVTIASTGGGGGGTVPSVKVINSTSPTIHNGILGTIGLHFDTTLYDQGTATPQHSTITNTDRLTCRVDGIYLITANIQWANNSTGPRELNIEKTRFSDGFILDLVEEYVQASSIGPTAQEVTVQTNLVVGDYVQVIVSQTSGADLSIDADAGHQYAQAFAMTRIG